MQNTSWSIDEIQSRFPPHGFTDAYRQLANALAAGGEDGVRDRGSRRRHSRLTDARRMLDAGYDVNFDGWRFVDAQNLIVLKIALLYAAAINRYLIFWSGTEGEDNSAFDLRCDAVRIYHATKEGMAL